MNILTRALDLLVLITAKLNGTKVNTEAAGVNTGKVKSEDMRSSLIRLQHNLSPLLLKGYQVLYLLYGR